MHHCESTLFLHLLIYHRVVYFAYLMALRDDMPLTLVVFEVTSTFIIWIQLHWPACVCVSAFARVRVLSNFSVSSVAKALLPRAHLSDSHVQYTQK